jgi:hypothetical protein
VSRIRPNRQLPEPFGRLGTQVVSLFSQNKSAPAINNQPNEQAAWPLGVHSHTPDQQSYALVSTSLVFFCTRWAHHPRAARSTVVARFPVVLATRELHHCRRRRASVLRRPEGRSSIVSFSAVGGGLVHTTGLHLQLAQLHLSLAWCPSRYLHPRVAPVSCPCR